MEISNNTERTKACKQRSCPVAVTGNCLESLELEDCPHFYWQDSYEDSEKDEDEISNQDLTPFVTLQGGDDLSIFDTTQITFKYKATVIIIIGESDSGKTTLASTIHEMFQLAPFDKYWFAGSHTPVGFEKRCHFSRISSGSKIPKTQKTKAGDFKFLHIALKEEDKLKAKAHNLLISDVSGEIYKLARNSSDNMRDLTILKTAARILLTIDGDKLANKKLRNAEIANAKTFMRKAIEENIFDNHTYLDLVITKWDVLKSINDFSLEELLTQFSKILDGKVAEYNHILIAARPSSPTEGIGLGFGIEKLLDRWINSVKTKASNIVEQSDVNNLNTRQINRMLSFEIQQGANDE